MKIALFTGTMALGLVWTSIAQAAPTPGRKLPGPSAVEAARLKKNPPPNYLAHYLPDDRYKIAGGVWKYVSTDLDTYYHVPTSPNMLRQPASRVIGFANSRDAEEAGYVPDPTDGTANKVAPPVSATNEPFSISVNRSSLSNSESRYLDEIISITDQIKTNYVAIDDELGNRIAQAVKQKLDQNSTRALISPLIPQFLAQQMPLLARLNRIAPPRRFKRYHTLVLEGLKSFVNGYALLYGGLASGNQMQQNRGKIATDRFGALSDKASAELAKIK